MMMLLEELKVKFEWGCSITHTSIVTKTRKETVGSAKFQEEVLICKKSIVLLKNENELLLKNQD
jgi:hypothetical protein